MTIQEIVDIALECGFDHAAPMDVSKVAFRPEVRDMCAADKCHMYNRSWACPPAIGPLEEIREKASRYSRGILVQCTCEMEDSFDMEAIEENIERHGGYMIDEWQYVDARQIPMDIRSRVRFK